MNIKKKNLKQIIKGIVNECISDRKSVIESQGITSVPHDYESDNKEMQRLEIKSESIESFNILRNIVIMKDISDDYAKISGDEAVFKLGKINKILVELLNKIKT